METSDGLSPKELQEMLAKTATLEQMLETVRKCDDAKTTQMSEMIRRTEGLRAYYEATKYALRLMAKQLIRREKVYEAQFYLLGDADCVFVGHKKKVGGDFGDFDIRGLQICLLLNDTFDYATADAEPLTDDECIECAHVFKDHGWPGIVAWAAIKRGVEPLEQIQTKEYKEAIAALEKKEA